MILCQTEKKKSLKLSFVTSISEDECNKCWRCQGVVATKPQPGNASSSVDKQLFAREPYNQPAGAPHIDLVDDCEDNHSTVLFPNHITGRLHTHARPRGGTVLCHSPITCDL